MCEENKKVLTREMCEKHAEEFGLKLGPKADKIIEMVNKNEGLYCPCKVALMKKTNPELLSTIVCPCENHLIEINETGHCHCTLYFKKDNIE